MTGREAIIDAAARSLRDDPTFGMLPQNEQMAEAQAAIARIPGADFQDVDLVMDVLVRVPELAGAASTVILRPHIPVGKIVKDEPSPPVDARPQDAPPAPVKRNPEAVAYAKALKTPIPRSARERRNPAERAPCLLNTFKEASGASDAMVTYLTGLPRSTVQAICAGRFNETLSARQRHALRQAAEAQIDKLNKFIAEA